MPTGLLITILVATILWYFHVLRKPDADPFSPVHGFVALYLTWFALGSMNLLRPVANTPLWNPISSSLWIYIGSGILAYLMACYVSPSAPGPLPGPDPWHRQIRAWHPRQVMLVGMGLLSLLCVSFLLLARQGALALLSSDPGVARTAWGGGRAIWTVYHTTLMAYVPLCLMFTWANPQLRRSTRALLIGSVFILLGATLLFANRSLVLEPALLAILTYNYARRRIRLRQIVMLSLAGLVFLSIAGMLRDTRQYGPTYIAMVVGWGFPVWSLPVTYIYMYVRDPVLTADRLRTVVPAFTDYGYGSMHLLPLTAPLPGHQPSPDEVFKELLHSSFLGFGQPATLIGHLYVDGGLVAIILGMYLFGLISWLVYVRMIQAPTVYRVLLHIWVAHVALWSLFTSLIPAITTVFVPVLMLVIVGMLSSGRQQQAGGALEARPAP